MKKKAIKIAASTAVAASAFVAAAPAQQADAATNVNQLITDAQNAGTVLKWAISVEGSANFVDRPYDHYNAAKKAIANAEKAAAKLSGSEKLSTDAKLVEPKLQVKRAGAYIDAITSSEKIKSLTAGLDAAIKTNDIEKVEAAYHTATAEYRKQAALLDRVYGQSTRDEIRNKVKPSIEKLVADVKNEVTVNMLAKSAASNAKAGKFEEAAKNLTDAQAILDANVLKWETALQKSVSDVEASIPLTVLTVTSNNKNEVTLKFSTKIQPGYAVLPAGQFTFSNGLIVQSATVAADGKTVTLTTTEQKTNTEYALSYQGVATGKSFKTPVAASDTTLNVVETDAANLDSGGERSYTVNVTKADGTLYTGKVKIDLLDEDEAAITTSDAVIKSVNGVNLTGTAVATYVADAVNGKVTFVVADGATTTTTTVLPQITRVEDGSKKFAPTVTFWELATGDYSGAATTVIVDEKNGFIYLNDKKYNFDSNDKFFFKNVEVTQADFLKALSKDDVVTFNYAVNAANEYNKAGISNFVINTDVTADAALKVTNPSKSVLTVDTNATRLEGTSQPGHIIEVYKGTVATGTPVASTTVASNGSWVVNSLNLTDDNAGKNDFTVTTRPVGTATVTAPVVTKTIWKQYFTADTNGLELADGNTDFSAVADNRISLYDVITLTPINAALTNNQLKIAANATISVKDSEGDIIVYSVKPVATDLTKTKFYISGVVTPNDKFNSVLVTQTGGSNHYLHAVTGITNQDNLTWNVSQSKDITLD
ncbi:hypothetical protein MKY09_03495 [Psychrobacillus sp. FSL K6-4046]|uniref:hypothetical protein n=1 Tax=Psychrobacillus sp. FSL K6-4046 TaxID=2921550 RepID=UPI00315A4F59